MFSGDIAIDIGTSNTLIYVRGKGILLNQPSVVSIDIKMNKIKNVGEYARNMIGKVPNSIVILKPIKNSVVSNFDAAKYMLESLILKAMGKQKLLKPKILVSVPEGITDIQKRAIKEAVLQIGVKKVTLVSRSIATALGSGIEINNPSASMILDIGGGSSEISVISLGNIIFNKLENFGGEQLDLDIINYIRKKYNNLIGKNTAEQIKICIGECNGSVENKKMQITGRNLETGLPNLFSINSEDLIEALNGTIIKIVELITMTLQNISSELSPDIMDNGIILTGGTSLLRGLDNLIQDKLGIKVLLSNNPIESTIRGLGILLDNKDNLPNFINND